MVEVIRIQSEEAAVQVIGQFGHGFERWKWLEFGFFGPEGFGVRVKDGAFVNGDVEFAVGVIEQDVDAAFTFRNGDLLFGFAIKTDQQRAFWSAPEAGEQGAAVATGPETAQPVGAEGGQVAVGGERGFGLGVAVDEGEPVGVMQYAPSIARTLGQTIGADRFAQRISEFLPAIRREADEFLAGANPEAIVCIRVHAGVKKSGHARDEMPAALMPAGNGGGFGALRGIAREGGVEVIDAATGDLRADVGELRCWHGRLQALGEKVSSEASKWCEDGEYRTLESADGWFVPPLQGLWFLRVMHLGLARFGAGGTLGCNIAGLWPFRKVNTREPQSGIADWGGFGDIRDRRKSRTVNWKPAILRLWKRREAKLALLGLVLVAITQWSLVRMNPAGTVTLEYLGHRSTANGDHVVLLRLTNTGDSPVSYYAYLDGKFPVIKFNDSNPYPTFVCGLGPLPEFEVLSLGESQIVKRFVDDLYGPWNAELSYYQGDQTGSLSRFKEKLRKFFPLKPEPPPIAAKTQLVKESLISTSTMLREREVAEWKKKMAAQGMTP